MTETATQAKAKTEVTTVEMTDNRKVDFAGKRKLLKESFQNADGSLAVRLDFRNGETRTFVLGEGLMAKFATHGAEQKLGDEIAGLDDVDDCVIAIDELIARLDIGEWGTARESNGLAGTSVLARALAEAKGVDIAKVKEFLKSKTQAEKVAMRNNAAIKPIIERIESEKAQKGPKVDTDALLAGLQ